MHGNATFARRGNSTTITASDRAIINYQSFNLNRSESVRFIQPGAQASVLNRIVSGMPTSMDGSVFANGTVYFVNPAGIYFGANSVINVGGIFAAAGNITNQDFLNNLNRFTDLSGEVVNHGQINALSGATLVGRRVANFGSIVAPQGLITLAAGDDVLIGQRGGKVYARLTGDAANPGSVENHGVLDAGRGRVFTGVGDHFALALYDTSEIRASSVRVEGGAHSSVRVRGDIDASSPAGRGGEIDVLGGKIALERANLDASGAAAGGQIHVGGDYQGKGERLAADLTFVDANSRLSVDSALGHAGRAIVWSDRATFFYGDVSAQGGGRGGFAEVSGKNYLDFRGTFDLSGARRDGTLLLDPKNITVVPNGTGPAATAADFDQFTDNATGTSLLDADLLTGFLTGASGEVVLQASNDIFFVGGASVIQPAGDGVDLTLFAGRRIIFQNGSVLRLDGGTLNAHANAQGFVAGQRDPGFGSIFVLNGAEVRSLNGALNFEIVNFSDATSTPGDIFMFGDVRAPSLTLDAQFANSRIGIVEDGIGANGHIGEGGRVTINAGQYVAFVDQAGDWSFENLDITAPLFIFDEDATGLAATGGGAGDGLHFTQTTGPHPATGVITQNTTSFTFTGNTTLDATLSAASGVAFTGTADLARDVTAAGGLTFQQDVTLSGPVAMTLTNPGDLIDFQGAVVAGVATPDLTLNLNTGGATFTGDAGTGGAPLGHVIVNNLGGTLDFQSNLTALSLTSTSGAGNIDLGGLTDLRGVSADLTNSLNLTASNSTIHIGGNILSVGNINFGSAVQLVGGGTRTMTLVNGGLVNFGGALDAAGGENLTLNLNTGGATFVGAVGGAGALNNILMNGLGTTAQFQSAVSANSVTSQSGAGTFSMQAGGTLTGDLNVSAGTIDILNTPVNANAIDLTWTTAFNSNLADLLRAATVSLTADGVNFLADSAAQAVDETVATDLTMRAINGASLTLSGDAAADAIDTINNVTLSADGVLRFQSHAGAWTFVNLAASGAGIEFDGSAGLTVQGQILANPILDATTGDITLTGIGAGEFAFNITPGLTLTDDVSADGSVRFMNNVELAGAGGRAISFTNAGSTLTFDQAVDSASNTGLTLGLNGGSATFTGPVGFSNRLGNIVVTGLGGTLQFSSTLTANSLLSLSGAGAVVLNGAADLDPTAGNNPGTEFVLIDADDITVASTIDSDLIDLTFRNSLSLGVLNAETVRVTAIGPNLVFRVPDNIGLDVDNLRLETQGGGDLTLVGTLPTIDFTGPAAGNVRNVSELRLLSSGTLFFVGNAPGDGANWLLQDLLASANQGIVFSVTSPQLVSWANALGGPSAFDADADNTDGVGDVISIASSDFTFGGAGGLFVLRDDVAAAGNLNFARAVQLDNGARRVDLLNPGNTVVFQNALTAAADNDLTLDLNGGGATFMAQVGDNVGGRLGDLAIDNLGTTLDFQADLFADALGSGSGAGKIILGGGVDLDGVLGVQPFSLNLLATNAQSIEVHGDINAAGGVLFATVTELFGGGTRTITLLNGGDAQFGNLLLANAGEGLTLNLNGGEAHFGVDIGNGGANRLGDILVNSLGGTFQVNGSTFASTLFINNNGGAGSAVVLGDGVGGDVVDLNGAIGANALDIDSNLNTIAADIGTSAGGMLFNGQVGLAGNLVTTQTLGNIIVNDGLEVLGDRTISVVDGRIDIFQGNSTLGIPVLLNNTAADSALRLVSNDGLIRIENAAGGSVLRSAGGLFNSTLTANSVNGFIDLGSVGGDGNALTLLNLDTTNGITLVRGGRYFARAVLLNAGAGHVLTGAPANIVFGDINGATTETNVVAVTGGNLIADPGQTVELNALAAGGNVVLDGARTNGANTVLNLNADNLATFGAGDTVGDGVRFSRVNVNSTDVNVLSAVFADSLFFNPRTGTLNFGIAAGPATGDMDVDANEVTTLNLGSVGTLFLGHNNRATAAPAGLVTNLFGVTVENIGEMDVFGAITVDGLFRLNNLLADPTPLDGNVAMGLFGPTILNNNAEIRVDTPNRGIGAYAGLGVMSNTALTTNGGIVAFRGGIPGFGLFASSINGVGGGTFDLSINSGAGRTTLFNVGDVTALDTFNVTGGHIFFNGTTYNAGAQTYTSDDYQLGLFNSGSTLNLSGDTAVFNDAAGGALGQITLLSTNNLVANFTNSFTSNATLVRDGSANGQSVTISAGNLIQFSAAIGIDSAGVDADVNSVALTSNNIIVDNVLTRNAQAYNAGGLIDLRGNRYQSLSASPIGFNGSVVLNPATPIVAVTTADGGTVNFNGATVNGNNNSLVVNTGANGVINFAPGIAITDAGQDYTAGNYNFLGSAVLSSSQPIAAIAFQGGTLNMGGALTAQTTGAGSNISLGSLVNLNGFDLNAFADGANSNVTLPVLVSSGGENVGIRANGSAALAGIQNTGVGLLDIRGNSLSITGNTLADRVVINTFDPARGISVGQTVAGTLDIDNNELAFFPPVAGGVNSLQIGEAGYAGRILINNATLTRNTAFTADGAGGLIRLAGAVQGTNLFSNLNLSGAEIQLGGAIGSNAGAFTLTLNGPVNVFGGATIVSNGGAVSFLNSINGLASGTGALTVNTGGGLLTLPETFGVIGGDRALASASFTGSPSLRLVGVNTTGNQTFTSPAITLLDGAAFTAGNGSRIAFNGPVQALGGFNAAVAGGSANNAIVFANDLNGGGSAGDDAAINAGANGAVRLVAVDGFDDLAVTGGTITLGGNLRALSNLTIQGNQVFLTGDRFLDAGNTLAITGGVDSQGAAASLSLENAIATLINGRLGGNARLASFTSSDQGTTTIQGGVFSNGLVQFRNAVLLSGAATVQTFGATAADGVQFLSTIDGITPGVGSLTVIVDRSKGLLLTDPLTGLSSPDPDVPMIELWGDIGANQSLASLSLNTGLDVDGNAVDGRDFVPANATIVLGNAEAFVANGTLTNITLNADQFLMGAREKLLTLGDLNASGSFARLSDMATIGSMFVNYDSITIMLREAGLVFDPTTQLAIADEATDFVSGGSMAFATIVALDPLAPLVQAPQFSLPGGDPTVTSNAGFFIFKSLGEPVANLIVDQGVLLDPRADGPSNTNVAEAIAGATPRQEQAQPAVAEATLSQAALEALSQLSISVKQPGSDTYMVDLPTVNSQPNVADVSRRRLEPQLVSDLVNSWRSTFVVSTVDAAGAEVTQSRRDEIKTIVGDAVAAFQNTSDDVTAPALIAYLRENTESQGQALTEINHLRRIVADARQLGLTEEEMGSVKRALVRDVLPENLRAETFQDLLDTGETALLGVR
ncbi:MAG: filamentous hemagglutinin N-terminal domain-containing protein [Phycisphaeraceae bacterium]|nr:MAG: filamentous hemagglutinin N-terminal domain-containing protein [Phycisphaeraceae bacterium]